MLHIILGILKIIGILLGIILLLLLSVFLAVLFVPVRYRGKLVRNEETTQAELRVTWLLHLISVAASFDLADGHPVIELRLFGVSLERWKELLKRRKTKSRKRPKKKQAAPEKKERQSATPPPAAPKSQELPAREKEETARISSEDGQNESKELWGLPVEDEQEENKAKAETSGLSAENGPQVPNTEEESGQPESCPAEEESQEEGNSAEEFSKEDFSGRSFSEEKASEEAISEENSSDGPSLDEPSPDEYSSDGHSFDEYSPDEYSSDEHSSDKHSSADEEFSENKTGKRSFRDILFSFPEKIRALLCKIRNLLRKIWGLCERIKQLFLKLYHLISGIPGSLEKLGQSIAGRIRKIQDFLDMLEEYEARAVLADVKEELFALLRHYQPREITGRLHFGTGDPAVTGQLTGLIYLLLPARAQLSVEPEFTEAVFEADLEFAGHIRAVHAARTAYHLFRNKRLMRLIKRLRKR